MQKINNDNFNVYFSFGDELTFYLVTKHRLHMDSNMSNLELIQLRME